METPTRRRIAWKAALQLGLISGTFSTLLITLGAPRIGRTRAVDWMTIGIVALGADAVTDDPGWQQLLARVLVHQAADLGWAVALFALGRYWTYSLSPGAIAAIAGPWALATSAPVGISSAQTKRGTPIDWMGADQLPDIPLESARGDLDWSSRL